MIDEPLIAIEVRPRTAKQLRTLLGSALNCAEASIRAGLDGQAARDAQSMATTVLRAIDRASSPSKQALPALHDACERALAWITNVGTAERTEIVVTLCKALMAAGSDAELLKNIARAERMGLLAAPACGGECDFMRSLDDDSDEPITDVKPGRKGIASGACVAHEAAPGHGGPPGVSQ